MNKEKLYRTIENICPGELCEEWDNSGIQINTEFDDVDNILVALEVTEVIIEEAISEDADLILTHHPLIFGALNNVDINDITGKLVYKLIKEGISVYSCHTNFDKMTGGNNDELGRILDIKEIEAFEGDNILCRKGITGREVSLGEFASYLADRLNIRESSLSVCGDPDRSITTLGWCTGAGAEFIFDAAREDLDLFITGDLKYHQARQAEALGIAVIDAGHYGTEKIFVDNMARILESSTNCKVIRSRVDIDPFI